MKHIKKFNEENDVMNNWLNKFPEDESSVKVKHLIEYLQQFDPEMSVELDKEGWDEEENPLDTIENSGLFHKFENTLFINN